jgi:hypothetical protein
MVVDSDCDHCTALCKQLSSFQDAADNVGGNFTSLAADLGK